MSKETKLSLEQTNVAIGQIIDKIPKQGERIKENSSQMPCIPHQGEI